MADTTYGGSTSAWTCAASFLAGTGAGMAVGGGARRDEVSANVLVGAIVEMSDDAIFICDAEGRVASWSATAERLFGRTTAEVLHRSLQVLFPEHLRGEVRAVSEAVLAGDRIRHFESEVVRSDGMPMPVSLSLCPLTGADVLSACSLVIVRDVTEQRLAQASLAEVEARVKEGEALAHVGSWLWDLRTGAVQWSAEFHRIHGVDPLDFDGTFESYLDLIHSEDRDVVRSAMEQAVASGRTFEGSYRVVGPDGHVRAVRVRARPAIGSAGAVVGLRGLGQEIADSGTPTVSLGPRDA
ncbi:MAG: sensory transduction histidine kinase [Acidimicrobiaceae bacterium]|jgi:PAS domain S-box-containing protein|nr:sensory transduction histidine kinase [Acidimicrobiaceae bacterium]